MFDYLAFREAFVQINPELGWEFDKGGFSIKEINSGNSYTGTNNADAVRLGDKAPTRHSGPMEGMIQSTAVRRMRTYTEALEMM